MRIKAPLVDRAGAVSATIAAEGAIVTFSHTYRLAPATLEPVDGSTEGGTLLYISAYGLTPAAVESPDDLAVTINGIATPVVGVETVNDDEWRAVVRTPASSVAGYVAGTISYVPTAGAVADFAFEYYTAPTMTLSSTSATLDGRTDLTGGRTATLTVKNLPAVETSSDVQVTFGTTPALVLSAETYDEIAATGETEEVTVVEVTVPAGSRVGSVSVSVTFVGSEAPPLGANPNSHFVRESKKSTA
eukprot:2684600-Rhodomonas_salina.1